MADQITIELTPNSVATMERLRGLPNTILTAIAAAMDYQNELTIGAIQRNKLSKRGPDTLGVVTGRLRKSINRSAARIEGEAVESTIGSNVAYAGVHEFGFSGEVNVSSFYRKNPRADVTATGPRGGKKLIAAGVSLVRSHRRMMNMPARAYIRTTIEERAPAYSKEIEKRVNAAAGGV